MDSRNVSDEEASFIYWLLTTRNGFILLVILTGLLTELNTRLRGKQPRALPKKELMLVGQLEAESIERRKTKETTQEDKETFHTPSSSPVLPSKSH